MARASPPPWGRKDEKDLTFAGFLAFLDRLEEGADEAIAALVALGVLVGGS